MSDPTGLIASALTTLTVKSVEDALRRIKGILDEHQPDGVVIGYPVQEDGEKSKKCLEIDRFAQRLAEVYTGPVHLYDESYSSIEAADVVHAHGKQAGRNKQRIDRLAAVIILQRFLDEQPRE